MDCDILGNDIQQRRRTPIAFDIVFFLFRGYQMRKLKIDPFPQPLTEPDNAQGVNRLSPLLYENVQHSEDRHLGRARID